jgi:hypothetical protein
MKKPSPHASLYESCRQKRGLQPFSLMHFPFEVVFIISKKLMPCLYVYFDLNIKLTAGASRWLYKNIVNYSLRPKKDVVLAMNLDNT